MVYRTKFETELRDLVKKKGGIINAHVHLDRAETLDQSYLAHIGMDPMEASALPLYVKQNLTGDLHRGPAYKPADLDRRMTQLLNAMANEFDTKRVDSLIDTTADNVGRTAFDVALKLKENMKGRIDFHVGSYPIFGIKDSEPERWRVFEDASKDADFLGGLPERDARPRHIGYKEHMRRLLYLAVELGKPVHMHVDQANDPDEHGTEELVHAVDYCVPPDKRRIKDEPAVWAVHAISPSSYDEQRFNNLLDGLCECGIGVICCPGAAISMKQNRHVNTPTHNSIARIGEMLVRKIPVRLGTDNIADVFVPSGTPDMYAEAMAASNILRLYTPEVWAKVLAGEELNDMDRLAIERSIKF